MDALEQEHVELAAGNSVWVRNSSGFGMFGGAGRGHSATSGGKREPLSMVFSARVPAHGRAGRVRPPAGGYRVADAGVRLLVMRVRENRDRAASRIENASTDAKSPMKTEATPTPIGGMIRPP